jgi:hypothetical protein
MKHVLFKETTLKVVSYFLLSFRFIWLSLDLKHCRLRLPVRKAYWAIEVLGLLSINQCNLHWVQCPKRHRTPDIFFILLLRLQFIPWHFCLAVNMSHIGATQRQQQSRVFPLVVCCATLTVAGSSNYSIDDFLVSSVSVRERKRKVKTVCKIVTVFRQKLGKRFPRRTALFSWEFSLELSTNIPNDEVCH